MRPRKIRATELQALQTYYSLRRSPKATVEAFNEALSKEDRIVVDTVYRYFRMFRLNNSPQVPLHRIVDLIEKTRTLKTLVKREHITKVVKALGGRLESHTRYLIVVLFIADIPSWEVVEYLNQQLPIDDQLTSQDMTFYRLTIQVHDIPVLSTNDLVDVYTRHTN